MTRPRTFRRVFVVGAYVPNGGTLMAYHLGRILERDFGIEAFAVILGQEHPEHGIFVYDLKMPAIPREAMEQQITEDDILIVNPGFSHFLFGWRIPGLKISYVQGFAQFNLLDRRLNRYVAVSNFVSSFLKSVYDIDAPVIPPFIDFEAFPSTGDWCSRPESVVLPYRKGIPEVWDLSFRRLQEIVRERAPHVTLDEPLAGLMPRRELLSRIGGVRHLLMLSAVEGFGLVPLEAMALGTLIVGYDGYGGRHYMQSGVNCAVAPYAEIERVADLLIDAVEKPDNSFAMAQRGRADAEAFTYDAFRSAWIKEFSSLLNRPPLSGASGPSQKPGLRLGSKSVFDMSTDEEKPESESLGLGLGPGDPHYRAYVGPPEEYDLIGAMTFNLLTTLGLRQHHTLADIGCGSLRAGRLLIPYLNVGKYVGIEPNRWLVDEAIRREIGADLIRIKQPRFYYSASPAVLEGSDLTIDFAIAQSIFSHCGLDLIRGWLSAISPRLAPTGAVAATFLLDSHDYSGSGWVYPDCVSFTLRTLSDAAADAGLSFEVLDWRHPRQTWALLGREAFDRSWFQGKPLTWNTLIDALK